MFKLKFTRIALATAVTLCALSAQATNYPPQPQAAEANALGVGVGIGVGIGTGGSATAMQGQQQGQNQAQALRNTVSNTNTAAGGVGGSGGLGGSGGAGGQVGNVTGGNLDMSGASIGGVAIERSAPPAYAPDGKAPRTSCRLFIGFGGSGTGGALSGGIPIGNDQTCVSGAQIEFFDKINKVAPNTFTAADYLRAACAVEGVAVAEACKRAAGN